MELYTALTTQVETMKRDRKQKRNKKDRLLKRENLNLYFLHEYTTGKKSNGENGC